VGVLIDAGRGPSKCHGCSWGWQTNDEREQHLGGGGMRLSSCLGSLDGLTGVRRVMPVGCGPRRFPEYGWWRETHLPAWWICRLVSRPSKRLRTVEIRRAPGRNYPGHRHSHLGDLAGCIRAALRARGAAPNAFVLWPAWRSLAQRAPVARSGSEPFGLS